jgi:hypothetical protein
MLKLSFSRTRFDSNYSNCTGRSIENISCSSGGAQEKGKTRWNSITTKINFEHSPPLNANVLFCRCFLISSSSRFWWCLSLTLRISLIRSKKWRIGHWAVGKSVSVWMHRRLPWSPLLYKSIYLLQNDYEQVLSSFGSHFSSLGSLCFSVIPSSQFCCLCRSAFLSELNWKPRKI